MNNMTMNEEVRSYIEAVERELDDLPEAERRELIEDLADHLHEVAADGDESLEQRIGAPAAYAAELRASAGLPDRKTVRWQLVSAATRRWHEFRQHRSVGAVAEFMPRLHPAWWVLRGYLAVLVADEILFIPNRGPAIFGLPFPRFAGSEVWGVLGTIVAIVVSVMLGLRSDNDRRLRYLSIAASAVVLVAALATSPFEPLYDEYVGTEYAQTVMPEWLHHTDGSAISNICAYDSKLRPQGRILLYDQDGRPIDNTAPPEWGDETIPGAELERTLGNAFPRPQKIVDPNTGNPKSFACPTLEEPVAPKPLKKKG